MIWLLLILKWYALGCGVAFVAVAGTLLGRCMEDRSPTEAYEWWIVAYWTLASWLAAVFIVYAGISILWCRQPRGYIVTDKTKEDI